MEELLGDEFSCVVRDLQFQIGFDLAVTIAIIVLLQAKFQFCMDLWMLMSEQAKDYVDQKLPHGPEKERLYQTAKERLQSVRVPLSKHSVAPKYRVCRGLFRSLFSSAETSHSAETQSGPASLESGSQRACALVDVEEGLSRKRVALETAPVDE